MSNQVTRTREGVKWSVLDQVVKQAVLLLISAVLSRLVTPSEYGLLAMVTLAIGFLQVIKDMGLGASIVYKKEASAEEKSTIFWINALVGLILFLILFMLAPSIALFFDENKLSGLIRVMAIGFLVSSLSVVPEALILKAMDFKGLFFRNLIAVLVSGVTGIVLAFSGWGVWSLVAQSILLSLINLFFNFRLSGWVPRRIFNLSSVRSHFRYSMPLFADSSINYWVRNIDNLLVGKILGTVSLGIYSKAYSLMLLPVRQISMTFSKVLFPSFAMIQDETDLIWNQFGRVSAAIASVTFGLMACLGFNAELVILVVYGRQWTEVVPIFRILCFLGAIQSLASLAGSIYAARGKTALMFKVGLVSKSVMILAIITGIIQFGLTGMVWSYLFASSAAFLFELYFLTGILDKKLSDYFSVLSAELISATCLLLYFLAYRFIRNEFLPEVSAAGYAWDLLILISGVLIYYFLLRKFNSKGLRLILSQIYGNGK